MDSDSEDELPPKEKLLRRFYKGLRMSSLLLWWIFFTLSLIYNKEHHEHVEMISISVDKPYVKTISGSMMPTKDLFGIELQGNLITEHVVNHPNKGTLEVKFVSTKGDKKNFEVTKNEWIVGLQDPQFGLTNEIAKRAFELSSDATEFQFSITGRDFPDSIPLQLKFFPNLVSSRKTVILALLLLISLYVLIIWDIVDRVFASLLAATTAIGILAWLNLRPPIEDIVRWIDIPTLVLLFGMMILVALLSDTGIFDLVAVYCYKLSRGHPWPLISTICILTGLLSAFLDNVTMMLLMTPVTIRLCEVMDLNVVNVLIIVVVFSNIGGAMTPVGDPPNVIISNNPIVKQSGVDFLIFTLHMFPVIIICLLVTLLQVRFTFGKEGLVNPPDDEQKKLERELLAWKNAKSSLGQISAREQEAAAQITAKIAILKEKYKAALDKPTFGLKPTSTYVDTLSEMEARYPIRNKPLLYKSIVALVFAISMFFLHSTPTFAGMSLEWAALLAALLLLILSGNEDISYVIERVEWPTLLFFAALFVLMESLAEMGLIEWIGLQTVKLIENVNDRYRLALGIVLILWISGVTSAFVDNIPVTQMMIKICIHVYMNDKLKLPLTPLVWSLSLGACLGGNGTLIGASANVVCAGIAAQHGYKFTFYEFFKIAFPLTLSTLAISTAYLLLCHSAAKWH